MTAFTIDINGREQKLNVVPELPLLWVLRDVLGLTGTKYGCGVGLCGSCTVHLDGKASRSCMTTVEEAAGKQVVTIEGLSAGGLHAVQQAWLDERVSQCGYCQPGQIMTAVALLRENPRPADEDIDRAMSGTLCRCGTYQRIRRAIHRSAGQE